jgi:hypothetical protein
MQIRRRFYARRQSSSLPPDWVPNDDGPSSRGRAAAWRDGAVVVSVPDDGAMLRPFTVNGLENTATGMILWRLCAALLFATAVFVALLVTVGHGDLNNGYFVGALVFGLTWLTALIFICGADSQLVVDPRGVHVNQGPITRSIPWDQLEDVTTDPSRGEQRNSRLVFHTRSSRIRSDAPDAWARGPRGELRLAQLAATIMTYRDRIRVGNAKWETTIGDDASRTM